MSPFIPSQRGPSDGGRAASTGKSQPSAPSRTRRKALRRCPGCGRTETLTRGGVVRRHVRRAFRTPRQLVGTARAVRLCQGSGRTPALGPVASRQGLTPSMARRLSTGAERPDGRLAGRSTTLASRLRGAGFAASSDGVLVVTLLGRRALLDDAQVHALRDVTATGCLAPTVPQETRRGLARWRLVEFRDADGTHADGGGFSPLVRVPYVTRLGRAVAEVRW